MDKLIFNELTLNAWKNIDPLRWQKLVHEVLSIYLSTAPEQFIQLQKACEKSQWDQVQKIAHTLKSGCGTVGAEMSHIMLAEVEKLAHRNETAAIKINLEKLEPIFLQAIIELQQYQKSLIQAA